MAYPGGMTVDTGGGTGTTVLRTEMSIVLFGGLASMEAGAVHAAAAGIHAEHRQLAQIFIVVAALQLGVGLWAVVRSSRAAAWAVVVVNVGAIAGWLYTRLAGISWIDGLEVREAPQFADTACAALAAVAVFAAYTGAILPRERRQQRGLVLPAVAPRHVRRVDDARRRHARPRPRRSGRPHARHRGGRRRWGRCRLRTRSVERWSRPHRR